MVVMSRDAEMAHKLDQERNISKQFMMLKEHVDQMGFVISKHLLDHVLEQYHDSRQ
jgi:hypothetical protein